MRQATETRPDGRGAGGRGADDAALFQVKVGGLHCSFCVGTLETAVGRRPGVASVNVSLAHEEALITYDPARIGPADLVATIRDIGYIVRDPARVRSFEDEEAELRTERTRFLLAAAATVIALGLVAAGWIGRPLASDRPEKTMSHTRWPLARPPDPPPRNTTVGALPSSTFGRCIKYGPAALPVTSWSTPALSGAHRLGRVGLGGGSLSAAATLPESAGAGVARTVGSGVSVGDGTTRATGIGPQLSLEASSSPLGPVVVSNRLEIPTPVPSPRNAVSDA